jgi:hypothetical protein
LPQAALPPLQTNAFISIRVHVPSLLYRTDFDSYRRTNTFVNNTIESDPTYTLSDKKFFWE